MADWRIRRAGGISVPLEGGELHFVADERDGVAAFHVEALETDAPIGCIPFCAA